MEEKIPLLLTLLRDRDPTRTMVFVNTRREADRLSDALRRNGIEAEALSGDVPQRKRLRMLKDFQAGKLAVLIGTDVASRGLHVPGVSHVFNYDLPQDPEDYVHRIGRTARAGAAGDAISFGCETYAISLPDIEAFIGRKIPVANFDHNALVSFTAPEPRHRHAHGGGPRHHRPHGGGQRGGGGGGHRGGSGGGGRRGGRGRHGGGSQGGAPPG
jgi:ATP-dependent RNA helicase RhlB